MAGYSGTPLARKLGIKEGFRVRLENEPANYAELVAPLPKNVDVGKARKDVDFWHVFVTSASKLTPTLVQAMGGIKQDGMIWVSWPKKASGVPTDMTEDKIRAVGLSLGLVDVKVCAVDDTWSGLKLVIRKENRK